jgi:Protein of unknown function (DUF3025)
MPDAFLKQIDWCQPWLAPLRPVAENVLRSSNWRDNLNAAASELGLANHRSIPLKFVAQAELPPGVAYETFINESGGVPTRDNLHDFFNALVWLSYPRIKVRLNAMQAMEIDRRKALKADTRGKLRDAATIFDENAIVLLTSDAAIGRALRRHAWHELFIERRESFQRDCRVCLFGHALMEKLVMPYKAITGHTWIVTVEPFVLELPAPEMRAWVDCKVAGQLKYEVDTSCFTHLPLLGVPGWWPGQDEQFYADAKVFRPARQ